MVKIDLDDVTKSTCLQSRSIHRCWRSSSTKTQGTSMGNQIAPVLATFAIDVNRAPGHIHDMKEQFASSP